MQPLNLQKLTPWNLEANINIFISDLGVNPKTLLNLTFKEIAGFHKSPTVSVKEEDIVREVKAQNKFLRLSSHTTSIKPLRPDISDIELALIHSSKDNIPNEVLCTMLNITKNRLTYLRKSTAPLYKAANTPLPNLPLVTITDTSRYWEEDELLDTYKLRNPKTTDNTPLQKGEPSDNLELPSDYGVHYKDLLRSLESQAENLEFPINESTNGTEDSESPVPRRTSIPQTLLKEDDEDYDALSRAIWSYVSREEGLSGLLLFKDEGTNNSLEGSFSILKDIPVEYTSSVTTKKGKEMVLTHQHFEGGYNSPISLPKTILKLVVRIYNAYITSNITPPALEYLVINLLSAPTTTTSNLNIPFKPLSSDRGHCMPIKNNYTMDTSPLVYLKFTSKHYSYGVICHHCDSFLSNNTSNSCKHMRIELYYTQFPTKSTKKVRKLPLLYLYSKLSEGISANLRQFSPNLGLKYSLYYYNKDIYGSISSIYTKNLLDFYTNFSVPIHRIPFE